MRRLVIILAAILCCGATTSSFQNGKIQNGTIGASVSGGGGFTLIAHTSKGGNTTTVTTDAIDTTGATLLIAFGGFYNGTTNGFSDSKGNVWTPLTGQGAGNILLQGYWCVPTTVGSGHTFQFDAAYPGLCVLAFSGANASPFDLQDGNNSVGNATTIQAASAINPSVDGALVVSAVAVGLNDFTTTVDSGLNPAIEFVQNTTAGTPNFLNFGLGYMIQSPHASINPTWTISTGTSTARSTSLSSFKPQ